MPAGRGGLETTGPRERFTALAAAFLVQLGLLVALMSGFHVQVIRAKEAVQQLIAVTLTPPPPPVPAPAPRKAAAAPKPNPSKETAAPKAVPAPIGGSPGPVRSHASPSMTPIVQTRPTAPPSGGGSGSGPAVGAGAGGGTGGWGYGDGGGGGTDVEQIAGDIYPRDYPRHLGRAGIGGRVGVLFTVLVNGRATGCRILRSSGIPELDVLTCRLIEQRFRFQPATDRFGRPISDQVEYDHYWIVDR